MNKTQARNRLVTVVRAVTAEKREKLNDLKKNDDLARLDFVWHALLRSFSTMGRVSGYRGAIQNKENYRRITEQAFEFLEPAAVG